MLKPEKSEFFFVSESESTIYKSKRLTWFAYNENLTQDGIDDRLQLLLIIIGLILHALLLSFIILVLINLPGKILLKKVALTTIRSKL